MLWYPVVKMLLAVFFIYMKYNCACGQWNFVDLIKITIARSSSAESASSSIGTECMLSKLFPIFWILHIWHIPNFTYGMSIREWSYLMWCLRFMLNLIVSWLLCFWMKSNKCFVCIDIISWLTVNLLCEHFFYAGWNFVLPTQRYLMNDAVLLMSVYQYPVSQARFLQSGIQYLSASPSNFYTVSFMSICWIQEQTDFFSLDCIHALKDFVVTTWIAALGSIYFW